ncbi:phosphoenolpyruvate carboxylase [Moheibacter sediminis]|uniref:Phosphoenolpyruvate carboxylase n=1 Tax=Moheibacter sediminis TaxID=1434700 RepID=A0A1W1Y8F9_9FLAO|nr:phosphoenolpyruvate carboxylase [Moheibacter sediminis]SMC32436.1 Phosphoenolpyruvate carboxylase, type 1 [Moheibacter sediminis]
MNTEQSINKYRQVVENKYQIYNSLFMNLPYDKMTNIGSLIPFLYNQSAEGFPKGKTPTEIVETFFQKHTEIKDENEQIDLLFRFIQYIERQVVLFDSIEDAAFSSLFSYTDEGTIESLYQLAKQQNKLEEVKQKLADFAIRIVFTAHPTQFYPNNVLRIIQDLRSAVQHDSVSNVDLLLQQLGKTPFLNEEKPTPYDEAMSVIYYLRNVYYDAVGELASQINSTFFDHGENVENPFIQLGFWPGGDRDGNPFVTAEITRKVADELRSAILKSYYGHLKEVRRRLTFKEISEPLKILHKKIYDEMFTNEGNVSDEDILNTLNEVRKTLIQRHNGIFLDILDNLIQRVKIFGLHFASLDIRQNANIHDRIIRDIVQKEFKLNFDELSEEEQIKILTEKELNIDENDYEDELTKDTILNVKQLRTIQKLNGKRGVHRYIISDSETIFDVLNVYALFKFCGYKDDEIDYDIVPLFETIQGLDMAENTMDILYNLPVYKKHLSRRKNNQTIMLGFSDGTKDGGYLKANWEIYHTKETLTKVSERNGMKVIFFDGRGGPPARGGGKTRQFYASQGNTIANNRIELTIQGQTITSMYGAKMQAKYNFEQLLTAGIQSTVSEDPKASLNPEEREILDELANVSLQKYANLKAHEKFIPYLENRSTLNYYGKTNIGSRPSKRNSDSGLKFSDLRAIPFVGSWSQLKQNVPGYFGVGSALKKYKDEGKIDNLKILFEESSFFKTLILNSMMSMQKTYFPLTFYIENDKEYGEFWKILYDEFLLTEELLLEISGYNSLMEKEPINKSSILQREKIVLPLLAIQQYALEKIQNDSPKKEAYERMVTRSLFGNINASRNSA